MHASDPQFDNADLKIFYSSFIGTVNLLFILIIYYYKNDNVWPSIITRDWREHGVYK